MRTHLEHGIAHVECDSPDEALNALSTRNPLWAESRHRWCFRGQDNDEYRLIPSALRSDPPAQLGYTHKPEVGVQLTNGAQVWAEMRRLHEFYWTADHQGLVIPEDSQVLRTPEGWRRVEGKMKDIGWPMDDVLSLLAAAQHYGVATRLLDWSDRPLVAAYFACKTAAAAAQANRRTGGKLSVWALDLDWVIYEGWPFGGPLRVYVVTAPRAWNTNLNAQGGLFTTDQIAAADFSKKVLIEPVDQLVSDKVGDSSKPRMLHVTLDVCHAGALLRLLHVEGVNAATVYPGFQGVAEALRERRLWDRTDRAIHWLFPFDYPYEER